MMKPDIITGPSPAPAATAPPARILVIDDDVSVRLLMGAALRKAGFEVRLSGCGEQGFSVFQEQPCDLVMLDVDTRDRSGFGVCERLRALAGDLLPIVMVTGLEDAASVETAYRSGATDFIAKPINWGLVGHRVRYLLGAASALKGQRAAHAALLRSQHRLQQAQAVARLGCWYVNLHTRLLECTEEIYRICELPEGTLPTADLFMAMVLPDDVVALRQARDRALAGQTYRIEYRIRTSAGVTWILETAEPEFDDSGRVGGLLGTIQDITEHKATADRIVRLAYFDSLTGLPNRAAFQDRLASELIRLARDGRRLAVLFMDLDGFKRINDTLGHETGDQVLQATADRLRNVLRGSDLVSRGAVGSADAGNAVCRADAGNAVGSADAGNADRQLARLGGDEFTVMLTDLAEPQDALIVASRIAKQIRSPFLLAGRDLRLTASIGIAVFPEDGGEVATLLKHADTAMYHAKERGRDNVQYYSAALTQLALERMNLERDLRTALKEGQFQLAFQPQLDTRTGRIESVEALIRWTHPERGPIPPLDFIPLAERNGLIVPIGECVLRLACEAAAVWQRDGLDLRVAVNLSPVQLKDPLLLGTVREALAHSGLKPELLELEVTETAFLDDSGAALDTLRALRALGLRLALDDFGTGYSSMSYLQRMPLNSIKIDQSFVKGLPDDKDSVSIVRAIISMARSLGLEVTAEGVETAEQARLLTELQCESLQGWHIGRPAPAAAIPILVAQRMQADLSPC